MARHFGFQQADEFCVHEFIFVGDVEAYHAGIFQGRAIAFLQLVSMGTLHHEDDVSPLHQFRRQRIVGVDIGSG